MKDVEEQAGGPVMNPAEMGMPDEKAVMAKLAKVDGYKKMFTAAYPGQKTPISFENMRKAIAAFERTLITLSKFDKFLAGETTSLDTAELRGLKTFMETGCTTCHSGSPFGGIMFQKYPLFGSHKDYSALPLMTLDVYRLLKVKLTSSCSRCRHFGILPTPGPIFMTGV